MSNIEPVPPRMGFDTAPFKNDSNNLKSSLRHQFQKPKAEAIEERLRRLLQLHKLPTVRTVRRLILSPHEEPLLAQTEQRRQKRLFQKHLRHVKKGTSFQVEAVSQVCRLPALI